MTTYNRLEHLTAMGLGPRPCVTCKIAFTPPPYADCMDAPYCPDCAGKRYDEWAQSPDGQEALAEARAKLAAQDP